MRLAKTLYIYQLLKGNICLLVLFVQDTTCVHSLKCFKIVSCKIAGGCTFKSNCITDKCQDLVNINTLKSKAEKSKDNKLALESNVKHFKCQEKNEKNNKEATGVCNVPNKEKIKNKTNEKSDNSKDNAKETKNVPNEKSKKYNAKEAKEKKNKEDTRNKNRENKENDIKGKETVKPFARNKEQLPSDQIQVHVNATCGYLFNVLVDLCSYV